MSGESASDNTYIDKIIEKVAKVHGYVLDKHDPVLVTATLNKFIVSSIYNDVKKAGDAQIQNMTRIIEDSTAKAANNAVEIIKNGIEENNKTLSAEAKQAANEIITAIKNQQSLIEEKNIRVLKDIKNARNMTLIAASSALASMLIMIFLIAR